MSLETLANQMASRGVEPNSRQGGLREIDIINQYFQKANIPPEQGVKLIDAAVKSGAKFTRSGNTLMSYKPVGPSAAQIYFFSVDIAHEFAQAMGNLLTKLKRAGVRTIYMNKIDPMIVSTMQGIGVQTQQPDKPQYKVMATL
jgi:transcription initiation factor TFIIIB Brf1 subunit/transcription initiation factor TFIIB